MFWRPGPTPSEVWPVAGLPSLWRCCPIRRCRAAADPRSYVCPAMEKIAAAWVPPERAASIFMSLLLSRPHRCFRPAMATLARRGFSLRRPCRPFRRFPPPVAFPVCQPQLLHQQRPYLSGNSPAQPFADSLFRAQGCHLITPIKCRDHPRQVVAGATKIRLRGEPRTGPCDAATSANTSIHAPSDAGTDLDRLYK